jgi:hypothetical protein
MGGLTKQEVERIVGIILKLADPRWKKLVSEPPITEGDDAAPE